VLKLDQEKDPEVLRKAAMILERENQRLAERVVDLERKLLEAQGKGGDPEQLRLRLEELQRQLQARTKALFGPKSERRGKDGGGADKKPHQGHPHRQQQLPIVESVADLDEADKVCTQCGGQLREWQGQEEESREIDVLCRKWFYRRTLRKKYRCRCGACIETAPAPRKLFPGALYSIDAAIEVAVDKYDEHMPLERQVRVMKREGLDTDSQTLWDQIERLARYCKGAYAAILARVQSSPVVFADETPWKLFGNKSENKTWQVWVLGCDDAVYYRIQDGRGEAEARELIGDYRGIVMCDGYKAYSAAARTCPSIQLAHCWSHVRRKFVEIEKFFPSEVEQIIPLIKELYDIEKLAPTGPPGDQIRLELRRERANGVVERIQKWAVETPSLPQSGLGDAIDYMAGMWTQLTKFLGDARIPLDNNLAERALRNPVIGRKNHYGSRSRRGTEVAAIFYAIIETCRLNGVDPKLYLRRVVEADQDGLPAPLPHDLVAEFQASPA
jgi:transposase